MRKSSKANSILRHESNVRSISFVDLSPTFLCNRSGLHLNCYGTKKSQGNFFHELAKLGNWQFEMTGMYTLYKDSIRVRNKNKGKRKKNKKVNSINRLSSQHVFEHIDLNSNDLNESFLSKSFDTLKTIL